MISTEFNTATPPARTPLVYHVEDDPDFADFVRTLLPGNNQIELHHFADGFAGLQQCLARPPDLILLDLDLPTLRGDEVCRLLRSQPAFRHTPIIICSSMPEAQKNELRLLGLGADAYFEKPLLHQDFLETVERLLKQHFEVTTPGVHKVPSSETTQGLSSNPADFPPPVLIPGQEFAGFILSEIAGAGGMGTVYRAREISTGREVALKVLLKSLASTRNAVERFFREARIMERINHPNIVKIYSSGRTAATYYIAMEFIKGASLSERIDFQTLSWEETRETIQQILDAVVHMHGEGILHRDLKPGNILVTTAGRVKVTDFGISRDARDRINLYLTQDAATIGTPPYMAPEQLLGAPASELTDQYSVGRTILAIFEPRQLSVPPRPLHEIRPDLPRPLSDAVSRCMHVYPSERFPDMKAARAAILEACLAI